MSLVDFTRPLQLKDASPVPDYTKRPITREMMRRTLIAMGYDIKEGTTRSEIEALMVRDNIPPSVFTSPPRPDVVYPRAVAAPAPAPKKLINVQGLDAKQLRAICKEIDPLFKPAMKSNRNVYLGFLVGRGLIDAQEAFADAD